MRDEGQLAKELFSVNFNPSVRIFQKEKEKKNGKSPSSLVDERNLSSNPVFAVRSNFEYPNTIIYAITKI